MKKLNILYIHSHDTGRFIQPYGFALETPNLQKFAEEAVLFRQAFSVSPACSPSRAGLLTGEYPHSCGMCGLASPQWGFTLNDYSRHLARFLRRHGFSTALSGVQHLAKEPMQSLSSLGYDEILNPDFPGEDSPDVHMRAAEFIHRQHDCPWFLSVGFDEAHRDNRQGDAYTGDSFSKHFADEGPPTDGRYTFVPPQLPDVPEIREDMARYQQGVRVLDRRIGEVLSALGESGQDANTLVIVTTDHGIPFPGMKCNLTDHGTGVMLMLRCPSYHQRGHVIDAMVSHLDLYPTICSLLEIEKPEWLQGKSLLPLIQGKKSDLHKYIFTEQTWHEAAEPMRAVRTKYFKFIRRWKAKGPNPLNCDEGPTKRYLTDLGTYFNRDLGEEHFFDLHLDPQECCNLISDPSYKSEIERLQHALNDWMKETKDPILFGEIPNPPIRQETTQNIQQS